MEEQKEVDQAPDGDDKTSDQLLKDIETAQRQLEESAPKPEEVSESDQVETKPEDKPSESEVAEQPQEVVPVPGDGDKAGGDIDEWMKKKGWKSTQEMARSLRNLEKELHKRAKQDKEEPRVYQFPAQQMPQAPQLDPNSRPAISNTAVSQIAEHYQMAPEDIQRLAPFVQDIMYYTLNQQLKPIADDVVNIKRESQKERAFKKLENDPLFQNREVLKEMHLIAEEDPSILNKPDYPELLFNESLKRIGRRMAENMGTNPSDIGSQRLGIKQGPPPSGRGSSGGPKGIPLRPPNSNLNPDEFNKLSSAEMEKVLKKNRAWTEYPM